MDGVTDVRGKRVLVMGLGRFGGGLGVTRWLVEQGARVCVTDRDAGAGEHPAAQELAGRGVAFVLGEHRQQDFAEHEIVVVNPAVPKPWDNPFLRVAQEARATLTTEIGLVVERLPAREMVVGVTGSAGKSTTSAMIAHGLREAGRPVVLGGNIGGSLLAELPQIDGATVVVLELSSAMLHWLDGWSPGIACVTNFSENHLDWHGTLCNYRAAKQRLLAFQKPGDRAALGPEVMDWPINEGVARIAVEPVEPGLVALPGVHNVLNASLAAAVARSFGVERAGERVGSFAGLPHRLKTVLVARGVRFVDDSKSTTPAATVRALDAMADLSRVWLIAGGYDKGLDQQPMLARFAELAGVALIGATGDALAQHGTPPRVQSFGTIERAMAHLASAAREGDTVLLSPGHASWDQYDNYEQRGRAFAELARELFLR